MADREKVIKGLEICTSKPCYCTDCPYKANCCLDSQEVMEDALALLKEQEKALYELGQLLKEQAEEIVRLKTPTVGDNQIPLRW